MNFSMLSGFLRSLAIFVLPRTCVVFAILACLVVSSRAAETSTISTGANVTLFATADGSPAPTFQWKKNGSAIVGATTATFSINNAALSDGANYRVTATNEVGSADSPDFLLEVVLASGPTNVAPTITLQPVTPSNATAGGTVNLVVAASGTPAPTFQWFKNSVAMSGFTNSTLSMVSITTNDNATYSASATNVAGSATSNTVTLVVTAPSAPPPPVTPPSPSTVAPTFSQQPSASQTVATGASVSFAVQVSGSPAPTIQWQKSGVAIGGATNATFSILGATTNDSGTYLAVATNAAGTVSSNPGVLTVSAPVVPPVAPPVSTNVAPTFTTQPVASQTVGTGASATLVIEVSGSPVPTIQWHKNGSVIVGATNATLSLIGATTGDSGTYLAVATNLAGTIASNSSSLSVSSPVAPPPATNPPLVQPPQGGGASQAPAIVGQPTPTQTLIAGSSARLTVVATGNPSPTFQWRKNGTLLIGATNAALSLNGVTARDAATYSVLVSNAAGAVASTNAVLVVNSGPVFTVQPATQAITLGAKAIFTVAVSAIPGADLQWMKNGAIIAGATKSVLSIDAVVAADLATYAVVATNPVGSATSAEAALVIAAPPVFTLQPTNQTVAVHADVTFAVSATGGPAPTFQWKKNGANIIGATNSTLLLRDVEKANEAYYTVEATNSSGWAVSNRAVLVVNSTSSQGATGGLPPEIAPPPPLDTSSRARIINLSVRAKVGGAAEGLIVGFVINGSAPKSMLLRGVGPALTAFGVPDALSDPSMALYSGAVLSLANDDWRTSANASQIIEAGTRLGAFGLPEGGADAAILAALEAGAYTVQVIGKNAGSGVSLVEVYDAAQDNPASLVNLSVRTYVGTGADAPNLGFVVGGTGSKRVVIRAVGPTLAVFGVAGVIADPQIELFRDGVLLDRNDNWGGSTSLSAVFEQIGAFGFRDSGSRDAALVATLDPGAYTVVVSGVGGSAGIALVEVYDVQ